ncbi:hypothetical protein HDU98_006495 [Podochytrium sp. JEL0797]|nr:hypothetical protein HDU98_006495 [Podochytrium sp. JEL0797]
MRRSFRIVTLACGASLLLYAFLRVIHGPLLSTRPSLTTTDPEPPALSFTTPQLHLVRYTPHNATLGFSLPELLDLCHYGSEMHISRFEAWGGDREALEADYVSTCFPIEISSSQSGRSMGHCSDYVQYIYHAGAKLNLNFGQEAHWRKMMHCPNTVFLHGEYLTDPLIYPPEGIKKPRNMWLLNLEQIWHRDLPHFKAMDTILCKTRVTCTAVNKYLASDEYDGGSVKPKVIYMAHSSPDPLLDAPMLLGPDFATMKQDFNSFIHIYGHSGRKRTIQVFDCWESHPEWPTLTMVGNSDEIGFLTRHWSIEMREKQNPPSKNLFPKNIRAFTRLSLVELRKLQISNGVHICPSQQERYGHYINEARALGALTVTTDWAPMNEFVQDGINGILIDHDAPIPESHQGMAAYFVSPASASPQHICSGIERVLKLDLPTRAEMGRNSRAAYESDTRFMERKMKEVFAGTDVK